MEERLQKILSAAGLCSRRKAEEYLAAGRVTVNGTPASLGDKADLARDTVALDGIPVTATAVHTYLMLHKPRGYVTTLSDEEGRPTVADLVRDCGTRVWPVGRLDMDSEGLLLLTDDGAVTHRVLHPSHAVEKEYHVTVRGDIAAALPVLRRDMVLEGEPMRGATVNPLGGGRLSVIITEGKKRQVRRMCAHAGLTVTRLVRVREGDIVLGTLPVGTWRALTATEIAALRK